MKAKHRILSALLALLLTLLLGSGLAGLAEENHPAATPSISVTTAEPLGGSAASTQQPTAPASTSTAIPFVTLVENADNGLAERLGIFYPCICLIAGVLLGSGIVLLCRGGRQKAKKEPKKTGSPDMQLEDEHRSLSVVQVGNVHHIGKRPYQQDAFGVSNLQDEQLVKEKGVLAVLADGMGGLNNSGELSQAAVRSVLGAFARTKGGQSERLAELARVALEVADRQFAKAGSGSTLILANIDDGMLDFISIGDSRIALCRGGALLPLNREHNYGAQMRLNVALGMAAWQQAAEHPKRRALTSYLDCANDPAMDFPTEPIQLLPGDKIILMSDGVYGTLDDQLLLRLLENETVLAAEAIEKMILSQGKQNQDNFTAVILEVR